MLRINKYAVLLLGLLVFTISCGSYKQMVNPTTTDSRVLSFGGGGGFTGIATTYYLLEDGQIFRNGLTDTTFFKVMDLDKVVTTQQFDNYDALNLGTLDYDQPGNRYSFLEMKEGKSRHKIQWGRYPMVNKGPDLLYSLLVDIVKRRNQKDKSTNN